MVESTVQVTPDQTLESVVERFHALRDSRSRLDVFAAGFVERLEAFREQVIQLESDAQRPSEPGNRSEADEFEQLLVQLAAAEAALERSERQLAEQQTSEHADIAQIDDDTRQLIDDLITERDALQQEVSALRRSGS